MPLETDYEFGKAAVASGFLKQEQLEECVEFLVALERVGSTKRLWDVALRRGFMRPDQAAALRAGPDGEGPAFHAGGAYRPVIAR